MAVLKLLWDAGLEDECASALSKVVGCSLEAAFFHLVREFDSHD